MPQVQFVDNAMALKSLRDSDFDVYSAYGEVIDNSIQAKATWIKINFEKLSHPTRDFLILKKVIFSDNGIGMNQDTLHRCMQMGFSSRYNDRSGIGRFGVGMTLASINQCKRIDIYSRQDAGIWQYTYIDLDDIMTGNASNIPVPISCELPKEYEHIASDGSGTIVVWSKYDRQPTDAREIIKEMKVWSGRTYRYFIWDGVQIFLDNEEIKAIDPLYVRTDKTQFPNDPKAEEQPAIKFKYVVDKIDKPENSPDESEIVIRMSLLPESFRQEQGVGGAEATRERYIDRNEGISIIRNRREVFYGHLPHMPREYKKFEEIDRWWGCEISFNAFLDRAFTVKNIKRGAIPEPSLKRIILSRITPTRKTLLERVRTFWVQEKNKKEQKEQTNLFATGHEAAEQVAKDTPTGQTLIDQSKNRQQEAEKLVQSIMKDLDEKDQREWALRFAGQPFTIKDEAWNLGGTFFETKHLGGSDVLLYNKNHAFFQELENIIQEIEQTAPNNELYKKLKLLIDLLIVSYSRAEADFEGNTEMTAEEFIELLRGNWGKFLRSYIRTWKKDQKI